MKVAQILDKFLPITEPWIFSQIKGLLDFGILSEIYCHKIINNNKFKYNKIYSYKDIPRYKINLYRTLGKLTNKDGATLFWDKNIKKGCTNIIHSHFGWAAQKGIDLALMNKIPHIVTFYGSDITRDITDPNKNAYQKKLVTILTKSSAILCTSNFLKNKIIKFYPDTKKIIVWRPPIKIISIKKSRKINNIYQIICVGRFIECKGQKYLIEAMPKILKKIKNLKLIFIGDGPTLSQCKTLSQNLSLSNNINFVGAITHPKTLEYINHSDLIVNPSIIDKSDREESLGITLVEAALNGIPAVASNIGGIPEIVINNKTGILVNQKNPDELATAIVKIMENRSIAKHFGINAFKHSDKLFNYKKQIFKLKEIYETI